MNVFGLFVVFFYCDLGILIVFILRFYYYLGFCYLCLIGRKKSENVEEVQLFLKVLVSNWYMLFLFMFYCLNCYMVIFESKGGGIQSLVMCFGIREYGFWLILIIFVNIVINFCFFNFCVYRLWGGFLSRNERGLGRWFGCFYLLDYVGLK